MLGPVVDVLLLNVPVALWAKTDAHSRLVDAAVATRDDDVSRRLVAVLGRIGDEYVAVGATALSALYDAAVRRSETIDVAYPVPPKARADFAELELAYAAVDADAKARGEESLVWPEECVTFRRWYLRQITEQLDGGFPTPY